MKLKIHIKIKGHAACGIKKRKHKLLFAETPDSVTCQRCLKAVEK